MAVFTIAMVSYAVDLAGFAPRPAEAPSPSEARELVAAGGARHGRHGRHGRRPPGRPPAARRATDDRAAAAAAPRRPASRSP